MLRMAWLPYLIFDYAKYIKMPFNIQVCYVEYVNKYYESHGCCHPAMLCQDIV